MKNMLNLRILKRPVGRPGVGGLWVLALLALPGCAGLLDIEPWDPVGPGAKTTAVFCDIPSGGALFQCPSPDEIDAGTFIRQASAAVALNTGQSMTWALDESPAGLAACDAITGGPVAREFLGPFPQGQPGCADPATLIDANAVCVALCNLQFSAEGFCSGTARASTNVPVAGFPGGCTSEGAPSLGFVDPRPNPEKVVWDPDPANLIGVTPNGNDLERTAQTSPPALDPPFDAGAASTQRIERGDAYVEFSADEKDLSHVIGLSEIPDGCADPCTDTDPSLADINFAISLNKDHHFYLIESGALILVPDADGKGPDVNGSFGTYFEGDRFRVSLRQSSDGSSTATVTYSRIGSCIPDEPCPPSCIPGNPCPETVFYTHTGLATYPLRVDTSFREVNAKLTNVTVVRIQIP